MGCFDEVEVCELVYTHILNQLKDNFQYSSVGIYRDDGLAEMKDLSGPQIEITEKELLKSLRIVLSRLSLK